MTSAPNELPPPDSRPRLSLKFSSGTAKAQAMPMKPSIASLEAKYLQALEAANRCRHFAARLARSAAAVRSSLPPWSDTLHGALVAPSFQGRS